MNRIQKKFIVVLCILAVIGGFSAILAVSRGDVQTLTYLNDVTFTERQGASISITWIPMDHLVQNSTCNISNRDAGTSTIVLTGDNGHCNTTQCKEIITAGTEADANDSRASAYVLGLGVPFALVVIWGGIDKLKAKRKP